jgi:hypothetical protein
MIMRSGRLVVLASAIFAASALCAESPMDCVRELTIPNSYLFVWPLIPATIQVHVSIGTEGKARTVAYDNASPNFRVQLDRYFSETAVYAESCAGKTIDFTVHYIVEGQKTSAHSSEVRFKPPNDFTVVCRPLIPFLDPMMEKAPPNSKKK